MIALEQFFLRAAPYDGPDPKLAPHASLSDVLSEPFESGLSVKINSVAGEVYDGKRLVASIGQLHSLVVHPDYRGRGIGSALIVVWVRKNPGFVPRIRPRRSPGGAAAYRKAWRILSSADGLK